MIWSYLIRLSRLPRCNWPRISAVRHCICLLHRMARIGTWRQNSDDMELRWQQVDELSSRPCPWSAISSIEFGSELDLFHSEMMMSGLVRTGMSTYRFFSTNFALYRITIEKNQFSIEQQYTSIGFVVTLVYTTHIFGDDICSISWQHCDST